MFSEVGALKRLGYPLSGRKVPMSIASIIAELDAEISRLEQARAVLGQNATSKGSNQAAAPAAISPTKRKINAAARKRIAAAQRKRWAEQKAQSEPAQPTKKSVLAKKRVASKMSAAGRKSIAAAQRKRWAAIKAAKSASKGAPARKAVPAKKAAAKNTATSKAKMKKADPQKPASTATEVAAS
jgi:hypothetical protein